eukprot:s5280_g1.t1
MSLEHAEQRMQAWMDAHPDFVFRPRDAVPPHLEKVYENLGESGPALWKNLRHHLQGEENEEIAGMVCQFMAERSTWRADKMSHVETQRKRRTERDADTSRMSVATGYTGMSTKTVQ